MSVMVEDFAIYAVGIVRASVCSSLSASETISRMADEPTGIDSQWTLSDDPTFHTGEPNPCPCDRHPETHTHYLFSC